MDTQTENAAPGFLTENLQILSSASTPINVEMVLRVWLTSPRDSAVANAHTAAAYQPGLLEFIEDVAATRQGVVQTSRNQLSISGLKQPADALVIARQIQVGLQGFRSRSDHTGPDRGGQDLARQDHESAAVSIAIDASTPRASAAQPEAKAGAPAGNDPPSAKIQTRTITEPSHDLLTLLKISKPAQVLLTHDLCQRSAAIKGLPLKSFAARFGVYEYLWTSQEKLDSLQGEPQLTLAAVAPAPPAAPEKKTESEPEAAPAALGRNLPETQAAPNEIVPGWRAALQSPRAAVFAGIALAIIAIGTFVGIRLAHPSTSQPAANVALAPNATSAQSQGATATPVPPAATQQPAQPANNKPTNQKAPHKPVKEKPVTETPKPGAECTLQGELSRYVALAEQARGRGDYANAIRRFREILACDPNNGAAQQGLNRAYQGQAQSR